MKKRAITSLLCFALCSYAARGADYTIDTADKLIQFASEVNAGTNYQGTTVVLEADISLTGKGSFTPIGSSTANCFQGVFDGNGHTISSLNISASAVYNGFFGYAKGATIKNVILDESCSIQRPSSGGSYFGGSSGLPSDSVIGSVVGGCEDTTIENCVSMVSFSCKETGSNSSATMHIGGIVGDLKGSDSNSTVRNCVNYGAITQKRWAISYIGGIVGYCTGSKHCVIQGCLNYGELSYSSYSIRRSLTLRGVSSDPKPLAGFGVDVNMGGILGYSDTNCVVEYSYSAGGLTYSDSTGMGGGFSSATQGGILGNADTTSSTIAISNCYYTGDFNASGVSSGSSVTVTGSSKVSETDSAPIDALNEYIASTGTSGKWLHNPNGATVTFMVDGEEMIKYTSKVISVPSFESESRALYGWYSDESCTTEFTESSVSADTTLYGTWGAVNTTNTTTNTTTVTTVTVTLSASGKVATSQFTATKEVVVGEPYGELEDAVVSGYTFDGWTLVEGKCGATDLVTSTTIVTKDSDHTLYGCLTEIVEPQESSSSLPPPQISSSSSSSSSSLPSSSSSSSSSSLPSSSSSSSSSSLPSSSSSSSSLPSSSSKVFISVESSSIHVDIKIESKYVEIIVGSRGVSKEAAETIIEKIATSEFVIVEIGDGDNADETRVIIKFNSIEDAQEFVRAIEGFSRESNIKDAKVVEYNKHDSSNAITMLGFVAMISILAF